MKHGISIVAVAALMLAAPAFASFSGTKTVANAETWDMSGNFAQDSATVITVDVGGLWTGGECQLTDGVWPYTLDIEINGTANVEQFKLDSYGTVVVNGDLNVAEGYMGKDGACSITINSGGTMTVDASLWSWPAPNGGEFDIQSGHASSINLVGTGTLRLIKDGTYTATLYDVGSLLVGNGGTTAVTSEEVGGYVVYSTVPEPATMSLLAIGGLALIRRRKRRA